MQATAEEKARAKWWTEVYQYHQAQIAVVNAIAYAKDTAEFSRAQLEESWRIWRARERRAPMPIDLKLIISPQSSEEDQAQILADNIWRALDHYKADHEAHAYRWLGPIGEHVIRAYGGWKRLWNDFPNLNPSFAKRDWKLSALAQIRQGEPVQPTLGEAKRFLELVQTKTEEQGK